MNKKMKLLIIASILALGATPFLYIGGQNNNLNIIIVGFTIFCLGMGMVLFLKLFSKPGTAKAPPSDGEKTS